MLSVRFNPHPALLKDPLEWDAMSVNSELLMATTIHVPQSSLHIHVQSFDASGVPSGTPNQRRLTHLLPRGGRRECSSDDAFRRLPDFNPSDPKSCNAASLTSLSLIVINQSLRNNNLITLLRPCYPTLLYVLQHHV